MAVWICHLLKSSPRYEKWREILRTDLVPIKSQVATLARFGEEDDLIRIYELDLTRLDAGQRSRLIDFIVERFGATREEVEAEIEAVGFPIRRVDVTVGFDFTVLDDHPSG